MLRSLFFLVLIQVCFPLVGQESKPYIILISLDGFRYDYTDRFQLPTFRHLGDSGAVAEGLIPCFPSKTFPNHYSIVTGRYPGRHGLVDNHFFDPLSGLTYHMRDRKSVTDRSFYGGTSIWELCRQNGIKSASFFWIGSEVDDAAYRPDYFFHYNQSIPNAKRTSQVIDWLKLPEPERPHFITLYFSSPDTESHKWGSDSEQTMKATRSLDTLLHIFFNEIQKTELPVNIFIVSDHGMTDVAHEEKNYIFIDELLPATKNFKVVNGGTLAHVYTQDTHVKDSLLNVLQRQPGLRAYKQENFLPHWRYDIPRAGDL